MSIVAVIPARGGSKGIPGKNLFRVAGIPPVVSAIEAARSCGLIDRVVVSTDDPTIAEAALAAEAEVVDRPTHLSGDRATSESAVLHALEHIDPAVEIVVFLQPTSPFIDAAALCEAIEPVRSYREDVVFSAVETFAFLSQLDDQGRATGVNHGPSARARRQDREPQFLETGGFYVMNAGGFSRARFRFFGRVSVTIIDERTGVEIDIPYQIALANTIAPIVDPAPSVHPVTFQKRSPATFIPEHLKNAPRDTSRGMMTYLEYRFRVEFCREQYVEIGDYATYRALDWFASPWDEFSVGLLEDLNVGAHRVASAAVTDIDMLRVLAATGKPIILSTGMPTLDQIDRAVDVLGTARLVILHATSTYPLPAEAANLRTSTTLQNRYPGVPIGYSGHERGLQISIAAVTLGAVVVERHIALDRTRWGTDQAASPEPQDFAQLVRDIRVIGQAMSDGVKRIFPGVRAPLAKLRRVPA